jgi:cytochrome b561
MRDEPYDPGSRLIHLLLALLGIAAVVSGQFAGDYFKRPHFGFDIHQWIGLATACALLLRLAWGLAGPAAMCFSRWLPVTRARLELAWRDLAGLARLRLPEHDEGHAGLAGVVQAVGLAAFLWMAVTGALLFAFLDPGVRSAGWLRAVKELHEGGEPVVLGYLALHVGAVIAHSLTGRPLWRRMFSLRRPSP